MGKKVRQERYKELSYADKYIRQYRKLEQQECAAMILIHPYEELQVIPISERKAAEILEDDNEVIFDTGIPDIYLSCLERDILQTESGCYLTGYGLLYRLDKDDFYCDLEENDFMKIAGYLRGRLQKVRFGGFCFPVICLTDRDNSRREVAFFAGRD